MLRNYQSATENDASYLFSISVLTPDEFVMIPEIMQVIKMIGILKEVGLRV